MFPLKSVKLGIADFLDEEFLPQFKGSTMEQLLVGTALSILISKMDILVAKAKENPIVNTLGIIDDQNNIDLDLLNTELTKRIGESGVGFDIPMFDSSFKPIQKHITFYKDDFDKLYECIKRRS